MYNDKKAASEQWQKVLARKKCGGPLGPIEMSELFLDWN
jgi:hypothetical protein